MQANEVYSVSLSQEKKTTKRNTDVKVPVCNGGFIFSYGMLLV